MTQKQRKALNLYKISINVLILLTGGINIDT